MKAVHVLDQFNFTLFSKSRKGGNLTSSEARNNCKQTIKLEDNKIISLSSSRVSQHKDNKTAIQY